MTERLHFDFSLSWTGEGNGNPLQCSCLENPRDGGAWWAAVSGISQSRTRLKRLSSSSSSCPVKKPKVGYWIMRDHMKTKWPGEELSQSVLVSKLLGMWWGHHELSDFTWITLADTTWRWEEYPVIPPPQKLSTLQIPDSKTFMEIRLVF